MKKFYLFILMIFVISPSYVFADHIYNIDINVRVEKDGSAYITEVWDMEASGGVEWCKQLGNLENYKVNDFYVTMDEEKLDKDDEWKTGGSLKSKAKRYGINYGSNGLQLCFGKSDKKRHKFMLAYGVDNYVLNTEDGQIMYHVLAPEITADSFFIDIISYFPIPEDIELSGHGYKGNSYVDNGRIVLSNYDGIKDEYIAFLAKFPEGTFDVEKEDIRYKTYSDALNDANNNGYEYSKFIKKRSKFMFLDFVFILLSISVVVLLIEFILRHKTGKGILKQEKVIKILDKLKPLWNKIKPLIDKIKPLCKKVTKFIKKIFNNLISLLKRIFKNIKGLIIKLKNKIIKKK